ncbi:medium chain dehydrogenase/reductase family protein [Kineococcus rhizosphaerae]|uniref:NADPH:quinone reductase-like Zn-dependent oxidoreductase n=1 Tax=Kineococcus rhizosphaerae TaxID=559628 RepID=A0A2T0QWM2_9ACTN|nr:medium chain dehydrogenase/reductase family protein [Kineococcus rhizosphaerae]PRY09774.1 NADPH:quinone reductase-like Zn-dependent oxidoreductase [Kineococcus rhizosphaerae]
MLTTRIVLPGLVEPDGLRVEHTDLPAPATGQALVAVEATGVSYAEQQMRRGKYYDQPAFPFVPGYDLVGTVVEVGPGTPADLVGRRIAAMTKTGGWSTHALVDVGDLVPVPDGVEAAEASTFIVNGVTAWQMLHRGARVRAGQTVLVHGVNGGVGTVLAQLALRAGARVLGTASARHHDALRALGVEPVDYRGDVEARVRDLAPSGVDAVFDHVGGEVLAASHRLLRRGGTLVSYGTAATRDTTGNATLPILKLFVRLQWWNLRPGGHRATFFNVWAGRRNRARFQARFREDLTQVFALLARGELRAHVAATFPLERAADALRLAESRTVVGRVVLLP